METKNQVISGVIWNTIQFLISRLSRFGIKLLLAKMLFPEQFGLIGMAMVFISFVEILNGLGMGAALIQRKEEDLEEAHYHTAFWTGIIWAIFLYTLICLVIAPLAASFYNEPLLQKIIPIISLGVLAGPVNLVHHAQLSKRMDFKKMTFIHSTANIFSGIIALILAYMGAGVWSLVFNSVASFVIVMPLYFKSTGWTPKFIWQKKAFHEIFGFGAYTTGINILNNLIGNVDYLVIGKLLSASALGAYTLAFVLTDTLRGELSNMMNKVMFPLYGKNQSDPIKLKGYYLKVVKFNSLITVPIMALFLVIGEPIILNFFGQKWVDTIVPMKILAVSVIFDMMTSSHTSLINGVGKPGLVMNLQMFKAVVFYAPLICLGVYYYGIEGAAGGFLVSKILDVIVAQFYLRKLFQISIYDLLNSIVAPFTAFFVSTIIGYFLYSGNIHFIIVGGSILFFYSLIIWLMIGDEIKLYVEGYRLKKKKFEAA